MTKSPNNHAGADCQGGASDRTPAYRNDRLGPSRRPLDHVEVAGRNFSRLERARKIADEAQSPKLNASRIFWRIFILKIGLAGN
jgi:hypothetical protein